MNLLEGLALEASFLRKRVEPMEQQIPKIKSRLAIMTSIRWIMLKPDMEALFVPVTSLQATLGLTVSVVDLDIKLADLKNHRNARLEREM